uniref:Uncharacterized protein n=1 Tax=Heliothis virescens TaxID=7102 RepID=A0A2A4K6S4_HELVI
MNVSNKSADSSSSDENDSHRKHSVANICVKYHVSTTPVMYCPPPYNDGMSGRPQPTKTTRTGNGNSCHDIV